MGSVWFSRRCLRQIKAPGRFPRVKAAEERYLGDLYISLAYVQKQCEPDGDLQGECTVRERLPVLVAHGICHLLGFVLLLGTTRECKNERACLCF